MATRLFLISLIVAAVCCRGTNNGGESKMTGSGQASADSGRDAIERALLSLPIDGRTYRYDLNISHDFTCSDPAAANVDSCRS